MSTVIGNLILQTTQITLAITIFRFMQCQPLLEIWKPQLLLSSTCMLSRCHWRTKSHKTVCQTSHGCERGGAGAALKRGLSMSKGALKGPLPGYGGWFGLVFCRLSCFLTQIERDYYRECNLTVTWAPQASRGRRPFPWRVHRCAHNFTSRFRPMMGGGTSTSTG